MLRPAAVTSLLSQLVNIEPTASENDLAASSGRPHTALLSLLDSSELYAYSSRLSDLGPSQSSVFPVRQHVRSRSIPLRLDERATCLSAIAVAAWRNATSASTSGGSSSSDPLVIAPGMRVHVFKHKLGAAEGSGKRGQAQDVVPLLLECELGRILIMPIVSSRSEATGGAERDDEAPTGAASTGHGSDTSRPFMLLSLNAIGPTLPASGTQLPRQPRSRGVTPSSTVSDATPTGGSIASAYEGSEATYNGGGGEAREGGHSWEEEEVVWGILYAQAKALARHLAPSLAKCGVGASALHDDENGDGRRSSQAMSEDEHDD